jgi:NAD+ diphosphatase
MIMVMRHALSLFILSKTRTSMFQTPASFVPLHTAQEHCAPHTFIFRGDEILIREADLALPDMSICSLMGIGTADMQPVGLLQDCYCHTAWVAKGTVPREGFAFKKLRSLFGAMDEHLIAVAGRAYQIAEWLRTHRYCGACATPTVIVPDERCVKCPSCAMTAYPRISPAMMVLIKKGKAILLARNAASPTTRFSALAGFLEAGESIEEAVHREVFEEVGLTVHNLTYFGSQSWPFPHSLMIAFTADYADGEITVDQNEIAEARWFGPGDPLPELAPGFSIAGALIRAHLPTENVDHQK